MRGWGTKTALNVAIEARGDHKATNMSENVAGEGVEEGLGTKKALNVAIEARMTTRQRI